MNDEDNGTCEVDREGWTSAYGVPPNKEGRSPLTGMKTYEYIDTMFTCTELEVFALE